MAVCELFAAMGGGGCIGCCDTLTGPGKPLIPKNSNIVDVINYYASPNLDNESENVDVSRHLQKNLFKFLNQKIFTGPQDTLPPRDLSRLAALKATGAATWMYPPPIGVRPVTDETCRHAHRLRLGLPPLTRSIRECVYMGRKSMTPLIYCHPVRREEARLSEDIMMCLTFSLSTSDAQEAWQRQNQRLCPVRTEIG